MSDIPQDILAAAVDIASLIPSRVSADNRTFAGLVIARAILAERERCADIADKIDQPGIPGTGEWLAMGNFAGAIRDAILVSPTPTEPQLNTVQP